MLLLTNTHYDTLHDISAHYHKGYSMLRTLTLATLFTLVASTATMHATTYHHPAPYISSAYLEGIKDATIYHLGFWVSALLCNFKGPFAFLGHVFGSVTRHCAAQEQAHQEAYYRGGRDAMALLAAIELLRSIATHEQKERYRYFFIPVPFLYTQ